MRYQNAALYVLATTLLFSGASLAGHTENVILLSWDGVRAQEIFGGVDEAIAAHDARQEYSEIAEVRQRYPGDTPQQRREHLLPNFWRRLAPEGMVFGNAAYDNHVTVQNRILWSTPGYTEILTGAPRAEVVDNDGKRHPYPTVLDAAQRALGLRFHQLAQFGSWDGYSLAASAHEGRFLTVGTYSGVPAAYSTPEIDRLAELRRQVMGLWSESSNDVLSFGMALEYLRTQQPRLLWIALVNSDDWAHADRYDRYLDYLHQTDALLGQLWDTVESLPAYRGRTSLVITTDHGRGLTGDDWKEHDISIPGSEAIWLAVIGPDTPDRGEVTGPGTVHQGQAAATLLQLLGLDSAALMPDALPPVAGVHTVK